MRPSVAAVTRFRRLAIAPACAALLVVAACGSDDGAQRTPADTVVPTDATGPAPTGEAPDPVPAADQAVQEEFTVPDVLRFSAPTVGGGEIDATSLAGTPTVFWFWAPT